MLGNSTLHIAAGLPAFKAHHRPGTKAGACAYRPGRYRLPLCLLLGRPPPWLAFPPLLAISRCFSGLIAANPRFEPPLSERSFFDAATLSSMTLPYAGDVQTRLRGCGSKFRTPPSRLPEAAKSGPIQRIAGPRDCA